MSDLSPGQEVFVHGKLATVVYVRGESVRVRCADGKDRTTSIKRVTPKRESKALTVGPIDPSDVNLLAARAEDARGTHEWHFSGRPVPKPVTLYSEPYLAYVRKHPCCLCGAPGPSEPHHWSHHGGVMGAKVDDYRTVPLCQEHHRYWHDHGTLPGPAKGEPALHRHDSEALFVRTQRELLTEWAAHEVSAYAMAEVERNGVDALIRAIGGADA